MDDVAKDAAGEPDAAGVVERAHKTMDKIDKIAGVTTRQNSPDQHVHVGDKSADKVVTWILIVAAAMIMGMNWSQAGQISDLKAQVRRLEDYQMTTFMLVPELRKKVEETIQQRKESK